MDHAPPPPAPPTVRVVVEDVCDLEERVSAAARRARECHRAVELVEPFVAECDHEVPEVVRALRDSLRPSPVALIECLCRLRLADPLGMMRER